MIIKSMTADFGTLEKRTLHLRPGLNIIEAPNESGKSTWCAFLRALFYGIDTAQRSKNGHIPDKLLYAPWNGSPMQGSAELTWRGRDITVERKTLKSGAPMREFSAAYSGTAQPVAELMSGDAGELLLGVPQTVWERTAFIAAGGLSVSQGPELEKRIGTLINAGDEEQSFSDAAALLRQWQRRCRYRNQGRLPEIETEIKRTEEAITAAELLSARLDEAETMQEKARLLSESLREDDDRAADSRRREIDELEERARHFEERADALEAEAESVFRALGSEPNEELDRKIKTVEAEAFRLQSQTEKGEGGWWLWLLALVAGLGCIALGLLEPLMFAPGAAFTAVAAALFVMYRSRRKRAAKAKEALEKLLAEYDVSSPEGIAPGYEEYCKRWRSAEKTDREALALREEARKIAARCTALYREAARSDTKHVSEGQKKASAEEWQYREAAIRIRTRLEEGEDPVVLQSRLSELRRERDRLERKYAALDLALDELAEADEEMQSVFSPALSREAGSVLTRLTGGKYTALTLDRDLSAMLRREGDTVSHGGEYLSRGTADQMYLAVRLSLCKLILNGDDPCPIVLDDALINFDDERMGYALDYLAELGEERQILLFTCHGRERAYMEAK